ncbi:MAG: sigma-70 family RNA polymerase sigma factor [Rhodopirellula sp.]|nr:sigma-70 family RNA polymerase sigma factor [Rhodopirellula sp.]
MCTRASPPVDLLYSPNVVQDSGVLDPLSGHDAHRLCELLEHHDVNIRYAALSCLLPSMCGEDNGVDPLLDAIPQLIKLLRDSNPRIRLMAAKCLEGMGPAAEEAVPELMELMRSSDCVDLSAASAALRGIGPPAADFLPELLAMLRESDVLQARFAAAQVLLGLREAACEAVPQLCAMLAERYPTRGYVLHILGAIGRHSKEAVPLLVTNLRDHRGDIHEVAQALASIDPDALTRELAILCWDTNPNIRRAAAKALGDFGPRTKKGIRDLSRLLRDHEWEVRCAAAEALGNMGLAARSAVPELVSLLQDPCWEVRHASVRALKRIGPESKVAIPELFALYRNAQLRPHLRQDIAATLVSLGPCDEAISALKEIFRDPDTIVVAIALAGLVDFGPDAQWAVADLISLLSHKDRCVRRDAAEVLGSIGPDATSAVPSLTLLLGASSDWDVRTHAARSLGQIARGAKEAVQALAKLLADPRGDARDLRCIALNSLARIGPAARLAVPDVATLLSSDQPRLASAAALALGRIGTPSDSDLRHLLQQCLSTDCRPGVQAAAASSLATLGHDLSSNLDVVTRLLNSFPPSVLDADTGNTYHQSLALDVLGHLGPAAAKTLPQILRFGQGHRYRLFRDLILDTIRRIDNTENRVHKGRMDFLKVWLNPAKPVLELRWAFLQPDAHWLSSLIRTLLRRQYNAPPQTLHDLAEEIKYRFVEHKLTYSLKKWSPDYYSTFPTYFLNMLDWCVKDEIRTHRSRMTQQTDDFDSLNGFAPSMTQAIRALDIKEAIDRLPVDEKLIIHFLYWEDRPRKEIAQQLGLELNEYDYKLQKAKTHLRESLTSHRAIASS